MRCVPVLNLVGNELQLAVPESCLATFRSYFRKPRWDHALCLFVVAASTKNRHKWHQFLAVVTSSAVLLEVAAPPKVAILSVEQEAADMENAVQCAQLELIVSTNRTTLARSRLEQATAQLASLLALLENDHRCRHAIESATLDRLKTYLAVLKGAPVGKHWKALVVRRHLKRRNK